MQNLKLKKNINVSFFRSGRILIEKDFIFLPSSLIPGEWVFYECPDGLKYLGFVNTKTTRGVVAYIVRPILEAHLNLLTEEQIAEKVIWENLNSSIRLRKNFYKKDDNYRLIYGFNDALPGLIVDSYLNCILIQIQTAGLDRFRDFIKQNIEQMVGKRTLIIDKIENRKNEVLPTFSTHESILQIEVNDNGFNFTLPFMTIQKNGFYFDHAQNRSKMENFLSKYHGNKIQGLDLFCYTGSWGMHLKRCGFDHVTFVDQGDYEDILIGCAKKSNLEHGIEYIRGDVFDCLDQLKVQNKKYDMVVCDPPAFSKDIKNLNNALKGYRKLYKKIIPVLNPQALLVCASCTYGVSLNDLSTIVNENAVNQNKNCVLVDIGIQGCDHNINDFDNKGYYLKYLLFYLEDN
ncbi:MAG: hypothetical protein A2381_10890 [Bdellovibrionales bacterium RIFOXYB1_FULL_37_110]|nr:MAG: hypothetical protein A2181_07030 [Bdellovibrionales bacterium RIFOXYA1_FULL_38_20]OFZ51170.1 MAG: hypothetical protein A2417_17875 [Bdellovibrionales bacterium RIFOXYC1_FULL_37_79]OFZ61276.1 MAG: hypothetical protein A2381_10890 [Bdellovibrionales bacterium RIFOXYB1_FULL_37_110]OFZ62139.1 MAG: hypothetical protein A2577_14465 [Bdellovibrionales bacterium RIFOXYD1_FULL_36_51]